MVDFKMIDRAKNKATKKFSIVSKDISGGLSTGSTLVNLALTGQVNWGLLPGTYSLFVGASRSGKTFLGLSVLAEASINKFYDKYKLIYYEPERGARMEVSRFFGPRLAKRLVRKQPNTVEGFYYDLDDEMKEGPCICVLDSMDSLVPEAMYKLFAKKKQASKKEGGKVPASYGTDKAKINSQTLSKVVDDLAKTGSILIIISQSRMNIGFGAQFTPETRSGGTSLQFYATSELWFKVREPIKRGVLGKNRTIGKVLQVKIKKNRDTGREPTIYLHHYPSIGFDDLGSLCAYLVEEGRWKESKGKLITTNFNGFVGSAEKLIQEIEGTVEEKNLRSMVADVWGEIESACSVKRKNRYQ